MNEKEFVPALVALAVCVGGNPEGLLHCEERQLFLQNASKPETGYLFPLPFNRGLIRISQNEINIATANFSATPWKLQLSDKVIAMDNVSIVLKHFRDTLIVARYRAGKIFEPCMLYKMIDDSGTKNITEGPDNGKIELDGPTDTIGGPIGGAAAVLLLLLLIISLVCYWRKKMRGRARKGSTHEENEEDPEEKVPMAAATFLP
ncbi:uncharacterized protein LOC133515078 [Syngnathoides biaculeatus]|uniref:uncharacterized protein LOC133515078 n=1 Tax=Syngnathoides biaculeatus TaxID=300417 RepID=UPI002ADD7B24|nr:uncharacterized protein LOC133515078 [Syngnathoides biaculeatus]